MNMSLRVGAEYHALERFQHRRMIAARQVGSTNGTLEQNVSREHSWEFIVYQAKDHTAWGVSRSMLDTEFKTCEIQLSVLCEIEYLVWLCEFTAEHGDHVSTLSADPLTRICQQMAIS
jgi:hypothetical protein